MTTLTPLVHMDWPWKSEDPAIHIILVSDEQFTNLANHPDEAVEKIFPQDPEPISLREHCRRGAERGATKLLLAYDYFFGGSKRSFYPDTEIYQQTLKKVHDIAQEYGLGLEPSIISPLELGVGYKAKTGESGHWMHYREGLRDTQTGAYSVMMWQHLRWCNNKGPTPVKLIGARAFAFGETRIPGTSFFAVNPVEITELPAPHIEVMPGTSANTEELAGGAARPEGMFEAQRVRVWGMGESDGPKGSASPGGADRVLVVLIYETVEMDYFSPNAPLFLDDLVTQYHQRGISLVGIYSDEMHIQQDWSYHNHFDNGQFNLRYVSPGLEKAFAAQFDSQTQGICQDWAQYVLPAGVRDFARFLVYFTANQHDFLPTHEPKLPSQHVFGPTPEAITATLQFRRDYYRFLEGAVVDLVVTARKKLEALNGREMDAYYHATWAESPTCDAWAPGGVHQSWSADEHARRYEYTPDFVWSNTIQQAAAACANYFLWNEFLTGGNNDVPEGGYADRDYYGRALACSLAALNRRPLASTGMWGFPNPVGSRMLAVSQAFGALGHPIFRSVQDYAPRQIEVLFLYPQDLVAVDERFGSWMVQYGYANYITAEKLIEYGRVTANGLLEVNNTADCHYRAICVLYEPFPSPELLNLLKDFVQKGGCVIWSGTPPLNASVSELKDLFGVQIQAEAASANPRGLADPLGLPFSGRQVDFSGILASIQPQMVLTDFVVDRIFPLALQPGVLPVAHMTTGTSCGRMCVGALKEYPGGGKALYLGFRPRDDQSASTGIETRTWYEILNRLGAYPGSDNPTVLSRTGDLIVCAFPNGALSIAPHFSKTPEAWQGGFFRDEADDQRVLSAITLPDDILDLHELAVAGQTVTYHGRHTVAWRLADEADENIHSLVAFAGVDCTGIRLNGRTFSWSDQPVEIAWHPLPSRNSRSGDQFTDPYEPLCRVWCGSVARVRIPCGLRDREREHPAPLTPMNIQVWAGAYIPWGSRARRAAFGRAGFGDKQIPFEVQEGDLILDITEDLAGRWLYVVQPKTGSDRRTDVAPK